MVTIKSAVLASIALALFYVRELLKNDPQKKSNDSVHKDDDVRDQKENNTKKGLAAPEAKPSSHM